MSEPDLELARPCPNCGAVEVQKFCSKCGQSQRSYRASVWGVSRDLLAEAIGVDGRLWRTLRALFFHPGSLSQAFSEDRRASYVSPVRLYLFASLLFFFLLAISSRTELRDMADAADDSDGVSIVLGQPPADEGGGLDGGGAELSADPAGLDEYLDAEGRVALDLVLSDPGRTKSREALSVLAGLVVESRKEGNPAPRWLRSVIAPSVKLIQDPAAFSSAALENLPIAMFILLPFYALLLKLIFFARGKFYAEHLVFALHVHVLAFLIFSAVIVLPDVADGWWELVRNLIGFAAIAYLGVYTYRAMRSFYGVSSFALGWRFLTLGAGYLAGLLPALLLVMAFTFLAL